MNIYIYNKITWKFEKTTIPFQFQIFSILPLLWKMTKLPSRISKITFTSLHVKWPKCPFNKISWKFEKTIIPLKFQIFSTLPLLCKMTRMPSKTLKITFTSLYVKWPKCPWIFSQNFLLPYTHVPSPYIKTQWCLLQFIKLVMHNFNSINQFHGIMH